ncbi:MAG TPA: hypothetical protein VGR96_17715 [Acidobacteriaceae bacterium]|nr:hypothetical protein [Acidobacteriaceae bacterium]
MAYRRVRRNILAAVAGYIVNAILVTATEQSLSVLIPATAVMPPLLYLAADLMSQCLYTVVGGYLCCLIARPNGQPALAGLIGIGLLIGSISLFVSWETEPHWYGIALLAAYAPCAWIGWRLRCRMEDRPSTDI